MGVCLQGECNLVKYDSEMLGMESCFALMSFLGEYDSLLGASSDLFCGTMLRYALVDEGLYHG